HRARGARRIRAASLRLARKRRGAGQDDRRQACRARRGERDRGPGPRAARPEPAHPGRPPARGSRGTRPRRGARGVGRALAPRRSRHRGQARRGPARRALRRPRKSYRLSVRPGGADQRVPSRRSDADQGVAQVRGAGRTARLARSGARRARHKRGRRRPRAQGRGRTGDGPRRHARPGAPHGRIGQRRAAAGRRGRGRSAVRGRASGSGAGEFPGVARSSSGESFPSLKCPAAPGPAILAHVAGGLIEMLSISTAPGAWLAIPFGRGRHSQGGKMTARIAARIASAGVLLALATIAARAETIELPTFNVVATTPLGGGEIDVARSPFSVWQTGSQDIQTFNDTTLPGTLARQAPGVTVNNVSGNDFQPDVSYRGFNATPVTGTPIGLAVYQNGVRINEAFG